MAIASTRALTPTQPGQFGSSLEPPSANTLAPLSGSPLRRSNSPISPRAITPRAMSPRVSPGTQLPPVEEDPKHTSAAEDAVRAAKAATQLSTPMQEIAKTVTENGSGPHSTGVSLSGFDSNAPTRTAPAPTQPLPQELDAGRPVVDPGLSVTTDSTPNRAYTFPPPLIDDHHTPARNHSVPNHMFPGSAGSSRSSTSKRHKCPFCSTEFTRHHNLKSHLLTHSQEKPYECTQCQQRFRRLHDLKRHTKLHTGERPHECNVCGRKFARGDALARHNKGPGGCAGRRPSFIEEDPSGSRLDDSMEDVEYTAEPENMDDDLNGSPHESSSKKAGRQDSFRPNTYPGVGPALHPMAFPPQQRSRDPSISSQGPGPLSSIQHFNAQSGVFQGSMTESPKPLSPGQSGDRSRGIHLPAGRGTSPMMLPTPTTTSSSGGPMLPGLHGFTTGPPGAGSLTSSHNSGSSAGSIPMPFDVTSVVRELEAKMQHMQRELESKMQQMQSEHKTELDSLWSENHKLKSELAKKERENATVSGASDQTAA
jgi:hypothetical protein